MDDLDGPEMPSFRQHLATSPLIAASDESRLDQTLRNVDGVIFIKPIGPIVVAPGDYTRDAAFLIFL